MTEIEYTDEHLERAAQVYGFVTMPDPVTLFPRQMEIIESIAAALAAERTEAEARAFERAAEIAKDARSEASLERHKAQDGEGKACWLWAFDTATQIERDIRALAAAARDRSA